LHWAALNGHLAVVKLLVGAGADMWVKNEAGHLAMFEAERADKGDVVQFLLEAGGKDVERVGAEGGVSEEDMKDMQVEEVGEEGSGDMKMSMGEAS
jgi:ankyrin repeat protein